MRTKIFSSLFAVMTLFFVSCSDDEGNGGNLQGTGTLSVQLTDAPFPYELVAEANVTVYKVEARRVSEDDDDDALTVSPYITLMEEEIETNVAILEMAVNHAVKGALGDTYRRGTFLKQRKTLMQNWSDYIDDMRRHHIKNNVLKTV